MEPIIDPVKKELIKKELRGKICRITNYGRREIYVVNHLNAPHVVREIGRLREIAFRDSGGGTGKSVDLDEFDLSDNPFQQLLVWDPQEEEIIGGYRFMKCVDLGVNEKGELESPTTHLFTLGAPFLINFAPYTIELGRSFIQPTYQAAFDIRRGMFSLDNLWDGLGSLVVENPKIKYFFGKMTMYPTFNIKARNYLFAFWSKFFPDSDKMVYSKFPVEAVDLKKYEKVFTGATYEENYKILNKIIREHKENIPPLVNAYMNLSPTMRVFGTAINKEFGNVEETGILITIDDVYEKKKARHINILGRTIKLAPKKERRKRKNDED
ncbi:MAG: GNAT family N-acetyltransferase [Bacteroidales bacterium]|jgi:hypothetical protein|nr:GNAT family N-acetyltransferase [Bacteroidales bacterium]